jgi:glucarate dehydratase
MDISRRDFVKAALAGCCGAAGPAAAQSHVPADRANPLRITGLRTTPVALPDPPLLAAGGCHGPYFLRNIIQLECEGKIVGIGETRGGQRVADELDKARPIVAGQNAFAWRNLPRLLRDFNPAVLAGVELACLDACGRATGRRLAEQLGGPVRDEVEFAAYLFYRYAADHPRLLADRRLVDRRGKDGAALDDWGEVRTPAAMARMAARFRKQWGFQVFKLKAGVLPPRLELETMAALRAELGDRCPLRIDPNARWRVETAVAAAKTLRTLNLEYYEDPVAGQEAMAQVRRATGLPMSTNMCVTRFEHVREALRLEPIDIVLGDHHFWGGIPACQELGRLCAAVGWRMSQHSNNHAGVTMAAMIALAAVTPQLTLASDTHYPWLPDSADLIRGPKLPIRDGKMRLPAGPGLGVDLDLDKVARAHETYRKCGMRERDDAFTMRLVEPGWKRELY